MIEIVATAVLRDFPLRIWHRQQEYTADLMREFQLLVSGQELGAQEVPVRLLDLADDFLVRYAPLLTSLSTERQTALDAGLVKIDSQVPLPAELPELLPPIQQLLGDVDDYCRAGDLLTLATPPDIAALRAWSMSEALRQFRGEKPIPWAGSFD